MMIFERLRLGIVVMEVGMGGRLDVTNAIPDEAVVVSTLTSIDLDHQGFLGNTVADIAREKVWIARRGKPFASGRQKFFEVEVVRNDILGDDIRGHLVQAAEPIELPSGDLRGPTPVPLSLPCFSEPRHLFMVRINHQIWELLRRLSPSCSRTLRIHISN